VRYEIVQQFSREARIHIGVPTYNGAKRLGWLLKSMEDTEGLPDSGIAFTVCNDGSPRKGELETMKALAAQYSLNLLHHPQNLGITASWNDIVGFVQSEFTLLLNDDVVMTKNWLSHLIYFLENNECGCAAPNILHCVESDIPLLLRREHVTPREPNTKVPEPHRGVFDPEEGPLVCMAPLGSAFGFKLASFYGVGGFDERMRITHNDSDFGTRLASKLRVPCYILPDRIWHLWSATFKENPHLLANNRDREAYIQAWGAHFDVTHPRYMSGMAPRVVKWIGQDGKKREREQTVQ